MLCNTLYTNLTRFIFAYEYAINYEMEACANTLQHVARSLEVLFLQLKKAEVFLLGPMPQSSR